MSTYISPSYTFDEYKKALNHQLDEESEEVVLEDMKKVGESVANYVASKMFDIFDDNDGFNLKHKYYVSTTNKDDKDKYKHPTIKPLEMVENHILHATKEGDTVLDCFAGSGTTLVACRNTKRNYIGFELDETYYKTAKDRLNNVDAKGNISLF